MNKCPTCNHYTVDTDTAIIESLNENEQVMLTLIASGYSRREMSDCLGVPSSTISGRMILMYRKLEIDNLCEATKIAIKAGLVEI